MELGGVQAAALVLGMRSSQSSEEGCPYDPWDLQRLANMVAHGVKDNFDFSESSSPSDEQSMPKEGDNEHTTRTRQQAFISRETDEERMEREDAYIVAYGAPLEPEGGVNADEQGGRIEKRISTSHTSKQTFAFGGGVGDGAENLQGASNSTHSVNLLDQIESHVAENQTGAAKIYVHGDAKLPISFAHHYAFRDKKLIKVSAQEFRRCFQIRKATSPEDKRWLRTALKHPTMPKTNKRRRGRPCDRFVIRAPHPLCESHLIVRKLKLQSMIWKGARPLSMPDPLNESEDDPDLRAKWERYAMFYASQFVPWDSETPIIDATNENETWLQAWTAHIEKLETQACYRTHRESDVAIDASKTDIWNIEDKRDERIVASGRLFDIDNVIGCFRTSPASQYMIPKYSARSRTLWNNCNRPMNPVGDDAKTSQTQKKNAAYAAEIHAETERALNEPNLLKKLTVAKSLQAWQHRLTDSLPQTCQSNTSRCMASDTNWSVACAKSTPLNSIPNPEKVLKKLAEPIETKGGTSASIRADNVTKHAKNSDLSKALEDGPFAEISQEAYDVEYTRLLSQGAKTEQMPLNREQRAMGRNLLKYALLRTRGKEKNAAEIDRLAKGQGLKIISMGMGAAGTGKSHAIAQLKREFERLSLGKLLVTAYTGVAAAPFKSPTLMKLLKLVPTQLSEELKPPENGYISILHERFKDECGVPIQDVGAIVVDEISFTSAAILGHMHHQLQLLLNSLGAGGTDRNGKITLCGGMPMLLCGDNHQKPPPVETPWFHTLVDAATIPGKNAPNNHNYVATEMGLRVVRAARLFRLSTILRAQGDPEFVRLQQMMRRTDVKHPVPSQLIDNLKTISNEDVENDKAWQFALIGVRTHMEGDVLNYAQLINFAKTHNKPIVRWKLRPCRPFQIDMEQVYEAETTLWGYYVQGAPILLTWNLKSARGLSNGVAALMYSLTLTEQQDRETVNAAQNMRGVVVTLTAPPHAINVIVGGTKERPRYWHGNPLPDLSESLQFSEEKGTSQEKEQIIPIMMTETAVQHIYSLQAARCLPMNRNGVGKLKMRVHPYQLAFALTDYKMQGRTMDKIMISLPQRTSSYELQLNSLYTFISRVRTQDGLRLLQNDTTALEEAKLLGPDERLHCWEEGYDENGEWSDERAKRARVQNWKNQQPLSA